MGKLNKKKVAIIVIAALVIIATITIVVILIGNSKNKNNPYANAGSISATESEFEALKIKDIELKYKEDGSETIIDFSIENLTDNAVENQTIQIQLLDENNGMIAGVETHVDTINAKSSHKVNMMLAGNIQGIKTIKLVQPEAE